MKVTNLKDLSIKEYQRIVCRSAGSYQSIMPAVRETMENVRKNGDRALLEKGQQRFGKITYTSLKVSQKDIQQAYKEVDAQFMMSLKQMIRNITIVHKAQLPTKKDTVVEPLKGITVWREWRPIEKVGIYIPGGKAIYPSSVLMSIIPAQIAGCREIVMCSPPRGNGQIPAPTLVAADLIGISTIFKVRRRGGAATTYGTESIPKVYKIFGAGNYM